MQVFLSIYSSYKWGRCRIRKSYKRPTGGDSAAKPPKTVAFRRKMLKEVNPTK